ncbi:MAG: hypothetical protein JXK07_00825 [Spirochaetes bacterium]|nr:hypothetical protein [Spirochaetota bacterium]MBN2771144.1 hypothetical protein [Spirochaetota bacterium]
MFKKSLILYFIIFLNTNLHAISRLDDIDKDPIGAYQGQILLGAFFSIGIPFGSAIDSEKEFIDKTTYTFEEQQITKTVVINHLNYSVYIFGEYIFYDHIGLRLNIGHNNVLQRTNFGKNYKNYSNSLYNDISILVGPSFHLTVRKKWDVVLIPQIGYSFASYAPAPSANDLFDSFDQKTTFTDSSIVWGSQIEGVYYFSNGFFLTTGLAFTYQSLSLKPFSRTQPPPSKEFNDNSSEVNLSLFKIYVSVGYAIYH